MAQGDRYPRMPHIPMPPRLSPEEATLYLQGVADGIEIVRNLQADSALSASKLTDEISAIGAEVAKKIPNSKTLAKRIR